jgi:hypothetical protein
VAAPRLPHNLGLHPDEERLLFAYIGAILKEVEIEERRYSKKKKLAGQK